MRPERWLLMGGISTNDLDPHAWLSDVLTRLPTTLDRDIGELLPHRWKRTGSPDRS